MLIGQALRVELDSVLRSDVEDHEKIEIVKDYFYAAAHEGGEMKRDLIPQWPIDLASLADEYELSDEILRHVTSKLAYIARDGAQRSPVEDDYPHATKRAMLLVRYIIGQRLRHDARYPELAKMARRWQRHHPNNSLILAFLACGLFGKGLRTETASQEAISFYQHSLDAEDADQVSRSLCLLALAAADGLADRDDRVLSLFEAMQNRDEVDHHHFEIHGEALRRKGLYEESLEAIYLGLDELNVWTPEVRRNLLREREFTRQERYINNRIEAEFARRFETLDAQLSDQMERATKTISESLIKIIEVLGLFLALVGFLVSAAYTSVQKLEPWQLLLAVALIPVGAVIFFVLLRYTVRFERNRPTKTPKIPTQRQR